MRLLAACSLGGAGHWNPLVPFLLEPVALKPDLMQSDGLHPTAAAQPPWYRWLAAS